MTAKNAHLFCKNQYPCRDYEWFACCEHLESGCVRECSFYDISEAEKCEYYRLETDSTMFGFGYKKSKDENR